MRDYQQQTKGRKVRYDQERYQQNRQAVLLRVSAYNTAHRKQKAAYDKKRLPIVLARRRIQYASDLNYKMACNLRSRLYGAIRLGKGRKSAKTFELIGCSLADLRLHIEALFTPGMSWAFVMSGKVHIDHVRPCASFDLTDPAQQRACFHYTNLQPLWSEDNLKKHKKWSPNAAAP